VVARKITFHLAVAERSWVLKEWGKKGGGGGMPRRQSAACFEMW